MPNNSMTCAIVCERHSLEKEYDQITCELREWASFLGTAKRYEKLDS